MFSVKQRTHPPTQIYSTAALTKILCVIMTIFQTLLSNSKRHQSWETIPRKALRYSLLRKSSEVKPVSYWQRRTWKNNTFGRYNVGMSYVIPLCNPVFEKNSKDKQRHTNRGWILKVLPSNSLLKSLAAVWLGCILTDGDTGRQSYLFTAAQKPDVKEVITAWWRSLSVCLE